MCIGWMLRRVNREGGERRTHSLWNGWRAGLQVNRSGTKVYLGNGGCDLRKVLSCLPEGQDLSPTPHFFLLGYFILFSGLWNFVVVLFGICCFGGFGFCCDF